MNQDLVKDLQDLAQKHSSSKELDVCNCLCVLYAMTGSLSAGISIADISLAAVSHVEKAQEQLIQKRTAYLNSLIEL